ncbi:MAG: hypothetical protein FWK04_25765 [Nostoc sp. GBBB01]|nr:hypothetical protein [Nostoc sp. GBBB01]
MGWWETGQGDDIIGDAPADTITEIFEAIASSFEEEGKSKPTLEQLLNAIFSVLCEKGADIFQNGEEISIQSLVAELQPTSVKVSSSSNESAHEELVQALDKGIQEIITQYQDSVNRKPRLQEFLACIKFVLGYNPEEYLSIEEGIAVKKIWVE